MTYFNADTAEQFLHDDVDAIICPDCDHVAGECICVPVYTVVGVGEGGAWLVEELTPEQLAAEALADARQEALADDTCYCDDVDICPPCARYLAARLVCVFTTDTTLAVGMTPEQVAAYEAEYGEDIYGRPL